MTDNSYIKWNALSDRAVSGMLGSFIRQSRLRQNKTQDQLAREAGISRSTLSLFEKGENSGLMVFIQLLRALDLLYLLDEFQEREQFSPLQLARLEHAKRQRVRPGNKKSKISE
jgi:transcriptional regulator with XRE-family HTH domain